MRRLRSEQGWITLIELLVAAVIIMGVAWLYLGRSVQTPGGLEQTTPGAALQQARGVECMSNLRSVRQAIGAYRASQEANPPSLDALQSYGISAEFRKCPAGGEPYQYDPNTGNVKCVHPGHGNY